MNDDVPSLGAVRALKSGDNRKWTPVECLADCIRDIETEIAHVDKLLILRVDVRNDTFSVGYHASNLKGSEILAVLECAKAQVLAEMGYPDD